MATVPRVLGEGDKLAGCTIERLIGRGGMGAVYLATHTRLEQKRAIKVLVPELSDDQGFRERFIRESRLAASLDHPNVITIHDAGELDGLLFIVMRYVEGADLRHVLAQQGPLAPERTLRIVAQVAAALDAAHASGLIHRDVKPANILLEQPDERVYQSDFGVAKRTTSAGFTRTGSFLGSVDYCAPEQINGEPVDARTDVYALGCVLFHCLAGQPPYERDTEIAVAHAHLTAPPPALATSRLDLPAALDRVVATAMAKHPDERYPTASALAESLRSLLEQPAPAKHRHQTDTAPIDSPKRQQASEGETIIEQPAPVDTSDAPPRPLTPTRTLVLELAIAVAATGILIGVVLARGG